MKTKKIMLTIEQAALEYAEHEANDFPSGDCRADMNLCEIEDWFKDAFKAGAQFAQQMTSFDEEKPPYYEPVIIEYNELHIIAWLAWSEEWGYVWTVNGTDLVLMYKPNVKWRHINIK